jgi:hypothetical protein
MKTVQKVLVSLLVATVIFTGFAIAAYSGLFSVIDTRFYNQRVRSNTQALLEESRQVIDDYARTLQQEIGALASSPALTNVFLVNQSRQDIEEQNRLIGSLLESRPEIDYIRVVDNEQGRLWYSSLEDDIRRRTQVSVEYKPVSELEPPLSLPPPESDSARAGWIPERGSLRVTIPMVDSFSIPRGTLVAWAGTSGVFQRLVDAGIIGPSNRVRLTSAGALVVNAPRHLDGEDLDQVDAAITESDRLPVIDSSMGTSFAVESVQPPDGLPRLVYLLNEDSLEMDTPLQMILLASVFLLTFIVAYLVLNIRQDPTVVVAERFRRFQESVVRDYLREGRAIDPALWQRELESRKDQIEKEMKRGLGRVSEENREQVEHSMQRSWDELSRLLGSGGGGQRAQLEPVSLRQIEDIIERTLARYGEPSPAGSPKVPTRSVSESSSIHPAEESEISRNGSDTPEDQKRPEAGEPVEVEELEELDEEVGEVEDLEPAEVAELDEAEELEELEQDADGVATPEVLDEAEEPVEVEELEELDEDVGEVEDLDGFSDIDQLTEPDEEPTTTTDVAERGEISDDWFEISRTALELAEEEEEGGYVHADGYPSSGEVDTSAETDDFSGTKEPEQPDVIEQPKAPDEPEQPEQSESEDFEVEEEAAELEPVEEAEGVEELEPAHIEEISGADVPDDEDVEELEEDLIVDDGSDPVDLEEVGHQPAPFFSSASSFGSGEGQRQWRSEHVAADRPSVYRADEIRPEAVVIRGVENTSTHHVVDLDDFVAFAGKNQTVIEEREGIIRIEAAAYFGEYRDIDQRTQALADQVMTRHTSQGIDDVFGASFGDLDFGDILGGEASGTADPADTPDSPLRVVSGGFELPYINVGGDSGVRQVYRQLVRLTRRWDARVALLLEETPDHGLKGGFGLGMPEECNDQILLGPHSDLARAVVPYQRVALLKQPISTFKDFAGTCQAQRLSAINSWLLLPLKDADHRRYLMVGFSRSFDDLMDLSVQYEIIPRAV